MEIDWDLLVGSNWDGALEARFWRMLLDLKAQGAIDLERANALLEEFRTCPYGHCVAEAALEKVDEVMVEWLTDRVEGTDAPPSDGDADRRIGEKARKWMASNGWEPGFSADAVARV